MCSKWCLPLRCMHAINFTNQTVRIVWNGFMAAAKILKEGQKQQQKYKKNFSKTTLPLTVELGPQNWMILDCWFAASTKSKITKFRKLRSF